MRLNLPLYVLSLTAFSASVELAAAQSNRLPDVRPLGAAEASVALGMHGQPSVRVLSDGRSFATEFLTRALLRVDPDLKSVDTLFDASTPAPLTYPPGFVQLVPAPGDTTLFYDPNARGFRVLDPSGRVVRRLGVADNSLLRTFQSPTATSAIDSKGRLVFAATRTFLDKPVPGVQPMAESLMVARASLDHVGWDSLAAIMGSGMRIVLTGDTSLRPRPVTSTTPVVDRGDAWTLTSSGSIAIIRSSDFHVDWIAPDGTRRSSPPVPWIWRKYAQAERDSLRASREALMTSPNTRVLSSDGRVSATAPLPMIRAVDTLPERVPAFTPSSVRPDLEGRVWIALGPRIIGPPSPDPVIYAIIDTTGRIVDRVELPPGRVIAGFGPAGAVYAVTASRAAGGFVMERYRYRP